MVLNKKGITFLYLLMLGTLIIVLGLALSTPIKTFIDESRNSTNMDCGNSSISQYDQATCVGLDITKPLIIGGIILIGVAVIGAKLIIGG